MSGAQPRTQTAVARRLEFPTCAPMISMFARFDPSLRPSCKEQTAAEQETAQASDLMLDPQLSDALPPLLVLQAGSAPENFIRELKEGCEKSAAMGEPERVLVITESQRFVVRKQVLLLALYRHISRSTEKGVSSLCQTLPAELLPVTLALPGVTNDVTGGIGHCRPYFCWAVSPTTKLQHCGRREIFALSVYFYSVFSVWRYFLPLQMREGMLELFLGHVYGEDSRGADHKAKFLGSCLERSLGSFYGHLRFLGISVRGMLRAWRGAHVKALDAQAANFARDYKQWPYHSFALCARVACTVDLKEACSARVPIAIAGESVELTGVLSRLAHTAQHSEAQRLIAYMSHSKEKLTAVSFLDSRLDSRAVRDGVNHALAELIRINPTLDLHFFACRFRTEAFGNQLRHVVVLPLVVLRAIGLMAEWRRRFSLQPKLEPWTLVYSLVEHLTAAKLSDSAVLSSAALWCLQYSKSLSPSSKFPLSQPPGDVSGNKLPKVKDLLKPETVLLVAKAHRAIAAQHEHFCCSTSSCYHQKLAYSFVDARVNSRVLFGLGPRGVAVTDHNSLGFMVRREFAELESKSGKDEKQSGDLLLNNLFMLEECLHRVPLDASGAGREFYDYQLPASGTLRALPDPGSSPLFVPEKPVGSKAKTQPAPAKQDTAAGESQYEPPAMMLDAQPVLGGSPQYQPPDESNVLRAEMTDLSHIPESEKMQFF